jgi:hypothetical protein
LKHFTSKAFWICYQRLPSPVQDLAHKNFALLKQNPEHPSLHFKQVGRFRSVRVGLRYRALGVEVSEGVLFGNGNMPPAIHFFHFSYS